MKCTQPIIYESLQPDYKTQSPLLINIGKLSSQILPLLSRKACLSGSDNFGKLASRKTVFLGNCLLRFWVTWEVVIFGKWFFGLLTSRTTALVPKGFLVFGLLGSWFLGFRSSRETGLSEKKILGKRASRVLEFLGSWLLG